MYIICLYIHNYTYAHTYIYIHTLHTSSLLVAALGRIFPVPSSLVPPWDRKLLHGAILVSPFFEWLRFCLCFYYLLFFLPDLYARSFPSVSLGNGLYFVSRLFPNYLYLCFCLWVPRSEQDWAGCLRISYDFQPVAEFVPLSMPSNTICFLSKRFHNCLQLVLFALEGLFSFNTGWRQMREMIVLSGFVLPVSCSRSQPSILDQCFGWLIDLAYSSGGLCILPWAVGGFTSEPIWTNV